MKITHFPFLLVFFLDDFYDTYQLDFSISLKTRMLSIELSEFMYKYDLWPVHMVCGRRQYTYLLYDGVVTRVLIGREQVNNTQCSLAWKLLHEILSE